MPSHVKYTQTKNNVIYLQSFNDNYLPLTWLFHLILTYISWLQPRKEGLHFILSDDGNHDFDVKVRHCGFVSFVNDVIDCRCLRYVFCFKITKKREIYILYQLLFYNILLKFFLLLQLNNYNGYVCTIYNCFFFMMNSLLIKFYNNYIIIQIQHSSKPFYIKHYNIIRVLHG